MYTSTVIHCIFS